MLKFSFDDLRKYTALASVFFCALLLLALGPSFQQHVLALLTSPDSSLYQSVYKDALIQFPDFKKWVAGINYFLYSFGAAALTWCVVKSRSVRGAVVLSSVVLFVFLNALDVGVNFWYGNLNYTHLSECVVGNLIGAPLTSAVLVVIVWLSQKAKASVGEHVKISEFVSAVLPAVCGGLVFLFQYYVLALFFNPTPSYVEAKTSPKSGAAYIIDKDVKERRLAKEAESCACDPKEKGGMRKIFLCLRVGLKVSLCFRLFRKMQSLGGRHPS
ncbi:hypothetical protein [Pseudomonas sp. NyZ201]|uniref:hypothetical protein n=1 Tax=Pseudomonas sp. NyZ201 TaxID=3409857 RepID=UPI003CF32235